METTSQSFTGNTNNPSDRIPANYFSELPVKAGAFAGFMGSVSIMAVVGILAIITGQDVWLSPRVIASTLVGEFAFNNVLGIVIGTVMHLTAGVVYGAIFARILPRMPRAFWFVAGVIFGVAIWGIAIVIIPILAADSVDVIGTTSYFSALIIAHLTYGLFLGAAGSLYGLRAR